MTTGGPIEAYLEALRARVAPIRDGAVATYIPALAKADPNHFGIAIATTDGHLYAAGDCDVPFTIQSVSKPFLYALALEEMGREAVMKHVGVEPTGEAFNATVLDEINHRPFNPMVNAGAIAVSALVKGADYADKRARMLALFERFAGRPLSIDEEVYKSERKTGDRNRAIAKLMARKRMIPHDHGAILDLYFSQCSVLVTAKDLALMAATLANGGVHPLTGVRALNGEFVHDVLTVMNSCGMYNYAGQWSYEIGVPAKSGVAGSIIAVIPGQIGIAAFSPPLDRFGNSVRAIAACKEIAEEFGLHVFRAAPEGSSAVRAELIGATVRSKRTRSARDRDILAAQGGQIRIVEAQGALFFGAAERLLRAAARQAEDARYLILDLSRVSIADAAACALLKALRADIGARGVSILVAHPDPGRLGAHFAEAVEDPETRFPDRDTALEWCENQVIAAAAPAVSDVAFSLAKLDLFRGVAPEHLKLLETMARPFQFEAGQVMLREGEPAKLFFVIAQGSASVRLSVGAGRTVRIASIGVGAAAGEMALLDGGPRSADVVADRRLTCYAFAVDELRATAPPELLLTIYANLARELAERLRASNAQVRALEA